MLILVSQRLWDDVDLEHDQNKEVQRYCYGRPENFNSPSCLFVAVVASKDIIQIVTSQNISIHTLNFWQTVFASKISSLERKSHKIYRKYPKRREDQIEEEMIESQLRKLAPIVSNFDHERTSLERSFHHLSQFTAKHPESKKMMSLVHDYEFIVKPAEEFERSTSLYLQLWPKLEKCSMYLALTIHPDSSQIQK